METVDCDSRSNNAAAKVIALDELRNADTLSVETKSSKYQFSVSDPSSRKGKLTGGALGHQSLEAVLTGTISEDRADFDAKELKTGTRAIFY